MEGDLVIVKITLRKKIQASHNYGGAYDIDPKIFFTRDDLDELADEVMRHVEEALPGRFKLTDIYIDGSNNQDVFVEVDWLDTGVTYMANVHVDMRKIRKPSDLTARYGLSLASDLIEQMKGDMDLYEQDGEIEGASDILPGPGDANPPEYDEPDYVEGTQEFVDVNIDAYILLDESGSWEYEDQSYSWACPESGDDWYSDTYSNIYLDDCVGIVEKVDELMADKLPDEPGRYHITGKASICFTIEGVEEVSTYIGRDEDDSDAFDVDYYTDNVEVTHLSQKDRLINFKCVAADSDKVTSATVSFDAPQSSSDSRYDMHTRAKYDNTRFSIYYNQIDTSPAVNPMKMFEQFRAFVREIHPYDDGDYASAYLAEGVIKFVRDDGKVFTKSYYFDADDMDVDNQDWCDEVISQAIQELRNYNKDVEAKIVHN